MKTLLRLNCLLVVVFLNSTVFAQTSYDKYARTGPNSCVKMTVSTSTTGAVTITTQGAVNDPNVLSSVFLHGNVTRDTSTGAITIPSGNNSWFVYFDSGNTPVQLTSSGSGLGFAAMGSCECDDASGGCTLTKGCETCGPTTCTGCCDYVTTSSPTVAFVGSGLIVTGASLTYNGNSY
jgi:hypothetical protein